VSIGHTRNHTNFHRARLIDVREKHYKIFTAPEPKFANPNTNTQQALSINLPNFASF